MSPLGNAARQVPGSGTAAAGEATAQLLAPEAETPKQREPISAHHNALVQAADTSSMQEQQVQQIQHTISPQLPAVTSPLSVLSLRLFPPELEQQFWHCESAVNVCQIMDYISLGFTVANHGLLLTGGRQ